MAVVSKRAETRCWEHGAWLSWKQEVCTRGSAIPHTWLMRHKCLQLSALWTLWRIAEVQGELIGSWYLKHRRVKTIWQLKTEVILHSWEKSWRNRCNRNWKKVSLMVVFWSNQRKSIKGKVLELTGKGNPIRSQWLQCRTVGFMMINSLEVRTLEGFRWKLRRKRREILGVFRRLQNYCWRTDRWAGKRSGAVWKHQDSSHGGITGEMTATVKEELVIHSSIKGRRFSCTGARVFDERDVDSWLIQAFLPNCCLHCINLFYQDKVIKHNSCRTFLKKYDLGKCAVLADLFSDLCLTLVILGFPGGCLSEAQECNQKSVLMS